MTCLTVQTGGLSNRQCIHCLSDIILFDSVTLTTVQRTAAVRALAVSGPLSTPVDSELSQFVLGLIVCSLTTWCAAHNEEQRASRCENENASRAKLLGEAAIQ